MRKSKVRKVANLELINGDNMCEYVYAHTVMANRKQFRLIKNGIPEGIDQSTINNLINKGINRRNEESRREYSFDQLLKKMGE